MLEAARLKVDPVWRGRGGIPHGDGRAVVLVPGFGGGDYTLAALAAWLRRIGYRPAVCGFLVNADCSERALERVERHVAALHARSGRRVAVIGHSRGGHFARAVGGAPARAGVARRLARRRSAGDVPLQRADAGRGRGRAGACSHRPGRARRPECVTYRCPCTFTAGVLRAVPRATACA